MVNLGFIKDASQSPKKVPRVLLRRCASSSTSTIHAWSDRRRQGVELCWEITREPSGTWAADMARTIAGLGWRRWWLDTGSLGKALGLPTTQAMELWGASFWPAYVKVSAVYLLIGDERREAMESVVRAWERAFDHVHFNESLDIDTQESRRIEELSRRPVRRTLAKVLPALFKSL